MIGSAYAIHMSLRWVLYLILSFPLLVVLAFPACTPPHEPLSSSTAPVAFEHVDVIPMDAERVLNDHTVLVENGRIVAVGPSREIDVPAGAERIDGRGKYLLPGLADMHVHPLSEDELLEYVRHGVTTVLIMRGRPRFLTWREEITRGERLGPSMFTVGPTTDGAPPLGWKFAGVRSPEDAECVVHAPKDAGYDAIKVYTQYTPEVFAAVNAAAGEVGLPVVGHLPRAIGAVNALAAGMDMVAHGEEYYFADFRQEDNHPDRSLMPGIVKAVRAAEAYITPMLSSTPDIIRSVEDLDGLLAEPATRFATPATYHAYKVANNAYASRSDPGAFVARNRIMYAFLQEFVQALHGAGVPLLVGTDAGVIGLPGAQVHRELEELVRAGLSPYEALQAATVNAGAFAAKHFGAEVPAGTITEGAGADLLLLHANPLDDITSTRRLAGVMAQGRWIPQAELLERAKAVAEEYPAERALVDRFDSLATAGQLREAVALARQVQQDRNGDPLFHESVMMRHAARAFGENPDGAIEMLQLLADLYPDFHAVYNVLGQAYAEAGDTAKARAAFQQSLDLAPCNSIAQQGMESLSGQ